MKDPSRFESHLDPEFAEEISAIPGGDKLRECIQCGTCSAVCPLSAYMDYTPRRLIAMTRAGDRDDVLRSFSIWVCASCYACTVECPKQIPITEIMHGLRRMALQEGVYPKRFPTPVMTREFVAMVGKRGRSTESWLAMKMYLRTNPLELLKHAWLGQGLVRRGRMNFGREAIRDRAQLRKLLRAAETPPSRIPTSVAEGPR